jgi:hypothetical protein
LLAGLGYSTTTSARAINPDGTGRPSAPAVLTCNAEIKISNLQSAEQANGVFAAGNR